MKYIEERNSQGQLTYRETPEKWFKKEYDNKGRQTRFENSFGYWSENQYDDENNLVHFKDSTGRKRTSKYKR